MYSRLKKKEEKSGSQTTNRTNKESSLVRHREAASPPDSSQGPGYKLHLNFFSQMKENTFPPNNKERLEKKQKQLWLNTAVVEDNSQSELHQRSNHCTWTNMCTRTDSREWDIRNIDQWELERCSFYTDKQTTHGEEVMSEACVSAVEDGTLCTWWTVCCLHGPPSPCSWTHSVLYGSLPEGGETHTHRHAHTDKALNPANICPIQPFLDWKIKNKILHIHWLKMTFDEEQRLFWCSKILISYTAVCS